MTRTPLGRLVDLQTSRDDGTVNFKIGLEHVEGHSGNLIGSGTHYAGDGISFEAGDVLFGKLRPYLAKVWLADRRGSAVGDFHVYRPHANAISSRYLAYFLLSDAFLDPVAAAVHGAKMPRASWDFIRTLPLDVPSLDIQGSIADYLDRETARIDTLIAKQEQLIATLRERRSTVLSTVFEPEHCHPQTRLKHVATVQTGVTLGGDRDAALPSWPYLRVANVQAGRVILDKITTIRLSAGDAAKVKLQAGDVLMTEGGDIDKLGRGAIWTGEVPNMLHQNHVFAVRPHDSLSSQFLGYYLESPEARKYFEQTAKKTTNLASTNKWTLGNLPIPFLSRQVQGEIVTRLDMLTVAVTTLIAKAERFIELSKERRAALITAAVTGQLEIPTDA